MSGSPPSENPEQTTDDRAAGTLIADKYRVVRPIGSGATGTVYLCEHVGLDRWVALKVLHRENEQNAEFVERFKREAKAASRLEHPNSVRVLDFGQEQSGALYIVMEYIEGRDLLRVLDEDGPFSAERAVDVMSQILDALSMAHSSGIVHRDLKPENIVVRSMLVDGVEQELVTVCDFGIAQLAPFRLSGSSESEVINISDVGTVVGTPAYMSPEQARAEPQDARSDIYSAGVVLFQLLTLQLPFVADTPLAVAVMHCSDPAPRPSQYGAVNPALEAICLKALSKTPEARYQTADEMRSDLQRSLGRTGASASRRHMPTRWTPRRVAAGPADAPAGTTLLPASLWPVERTLAPVGGSGGARNVSLPVLGAGAVMVVAIALSLALRESGTHRAAPSELQLPASVTRPAAQPSALPAAALPVASVSNAGEASPKPDSAGAAVPASATSGGAEQTALAAASGPILGAQPVHGAQPVVTEPRVAQSPETPLVASPASSGPIASGAPQTPARTAPAAHDNKVGAAVAPKAASDKPAPARSIGVRSTEKPLSAAAVASSGPPVAALGPTQPTAADKAKRSAALQTTAALAVDAAASSAPPTTISGAPPAASLGAVAPKAQVPPAPKPGVPAPVPATATVNLGPIATHGAVSKASIRNALNVEAITACYRAALRSNAVPPTALSSQLDLVTTMGGGIKSATLRATGFAEQPRQCIEQVARRGRVKEVDTGVAEASITLFFQPR